MSKPAKPVTLVFGRPNIGKYLVDTFEKYTEMPTDASDFGASASMTSTERDVRRTAPGREVRAVSNHLLCVFTDQIHKCPFNVAERRAGRL